MRKFLRTVLLIVAAAVALMAYLRANDDMFDRFPGRHVVTAHAAGAIDGFVYTNSFEAFNNSVAAGCRFIELDIVPSSDGYPIAFHSNPYLPDTLYTTDPPSLAEFTSKKIWGRYTPITARDIEQLLWENPQVYLVVDKEDNVEVLNKYFSDFKHRMFVECFSVEAYRKVAKAGYYCPMLNVKAFRVSHVVMQDLRHLFNSDEPRVGAVVINHRHYAAEAAARRKVEWLNKPVAVYTSRSRAQTDSLFRAIPNCVMVYTDTP